MTSLQLAVCVLSVTAVSSLPSFLPSISGMQWNMVGYLNMTDPSQQCPSSWLRSSSPRSSCKKRTIDPSIALCESLTVPTSGATYQMVCGRFRGYQIGSTDAFLDLSNTRTLEGHYVDGISITYGPPGSRQHVYTYAAGTQEIQYVSSCPCTGAGVAAPPPFVGSDYYCESGTSSVVGGVFYSSDVLWDGQQCGGNEGTCCNPPNLPWFCKNLSTPVSADLEVRICLDEDATNENVAIEFFELYILGEGYGIGIWVRVRVERVQWTLGMSPSIHTNTIVRISYQQVSTSLYITLDHSMDGDVGTGVVSAPRTLRPEEALVPGPPRKAPDVYSLVGRSLKVVEGG